jgi:allophanate hydrolase
MGSRLEGAKLDHDSHRGSEIISDGIVPGAIQVPGNGAPIVLLADGPTVGGYPKIATVISVDLPILATLQPGRSICFRAVNTTEAEQLLRHHRQALADLVEQIVPLSTDPVIPAATLNRVNLISGVIDGCRYKLDVPVTSDGD